MKAPRPEQGFAAGSAGDAPTLAATLPACNHLPAVRVPDSIAAWTREPHALEGPPRWIASSAHRSLVAQELLLQRLLDVRRPEGAGGEPLAQLTALVKTFERPRILRRLVASIKRLYPALRIVVVDDSRVPTRLAGVTTVTLPYDSGIAAGRNAGLCARYDAIRARPG